MFRGLQLGVKETVAILILIAQPCTNRQPERRSRDPSEWRLPREETATMTGSLYGFTSQTQSHCTSSLTVKGVVVKPYNLHLSSHFALLFSSVDVL
jgi:hypothetical protein